MLFTPTNPISKTKKTAKIAILVLRNTNRKRDGNTWNETGKLSLERSKTDRKKG